MVFQYCFWHCCVARRNGSCRSIGVVTQLFHYRCGTNLANCPAFCLQTKPKPFATSPSSVRQFVELIDNTLCPFNTKMIETRSQTIWDLFTGSSLTCKWVFGPFIAPYVNKCELRYCSNKQTSLTNINCTNKTAPSDVCFFLKAFHICIIKYYGILQNVLN